MTDYTDNSEKSFELETPAAEVEVAEVVTAEVAAEVEVEAEALAEPIVEPVDAPSEEVVVAAPTPTKKKHADPVKVDSEDLGKELPAPAGPAVVGNGEKDVVKASSIIYKNEVARKSLSVHHLQRRLGELGYSDATRDKDGYFGPLTRRALVMFQQANNLDPNGVASVITLEKLFTGDPNVEVKP